MYRILLSIILFINLAGWCCTYSVKPVEFELFDDKFRLSIPNDPDLKWVSFHVNINKEFRGFESGQLTGIVSMPQKQKWSYEFQRTLKDTDVLYIWLALQHNRLIFRDKKDPISIEAYRSGKPIYITTTSSTTGDSSTEIPNQKPITVGDINKENKICRPTISELPKTYAGGPYCKNDLIFADNFETLNEQYWTNEVRIPPTTDDAEFVLYNGTVHVNNGILRIDAQLNPLILKKDSIDLGTRCTSIKVATECSLTPQGVLILPPVISGRLNTKNYFSFKYGRIEVRAKLPIGDWLFPLISLEPLTPLYGEHYRSGEMRVAYARGNINLKWENKNINGARLFGGVILNETADGRDKFMKDISPPNIDHYGDEFHIYSLTWLPNELILSVDGNEYGRIETNFKNQVNERIWNKGAQNAPLDQMFYITLGLAAGGNGDFPQTDGKPWRNTDPRGSLNFYKNRTNWFPSWAQPSLEVDYVRVYAV